MQRGPTHSIFQGGFRHPAIARRPPDPPRSVHSSEHGAAARGGGLLQQQAPRADAHELPWALTAGPASRPPSNRGGTRRQSPLAPMGAAQARHRRSCTTAQSSLRGRPRHRLESRGEAKGMTRESRRGQLGGPHLGSPQRTAPRNPAHPAHPAPRGGQGGHGGEERSGKEGGARRLRPGGTGAKGFTLGLGRLGGL